MNNCFGYPLYGNEDFYHAYGYLHYDIKPDDSKSLAAILHRGDPAPYYSFEKKIETVIRANIKVVNSVCSYKIIPDLLSCLYYKGYNAHVVVFNPDHIIHTVYREMKNSYFNEKVRITNNKFVSLVQDTLGFSSIYFYIEPGTNTALEQCIKTRYKDIIFISGKGIYVQLCPQDTFNLIYDFMENVFNLI